MLIDIMLNGRFYRQVDYPERQGEENASDIERFIENKFPSLVGKKYHFEFSNQKL